jgi:two-component system response regulator HydG
MAQATVLLISADDDLIDNVRTVSCGIDNLSMEVCANLTDASTQIGREGIEVVLLHLTAGADIQTTALFLNRLAATKRPCAALILADVYRDADAITLLRGGAADYLPLPLDLNKLAFLLDVLTLKTRTVPPTPALNPGAAKPSAHDPFFYVVAPEMVEMMEQIRRVAPQDTTLLFTGETGTGKTRLARLIHDLSPRREKPFMVVDCGALSSNLIESEMFGHTRGAFTGADRDRQGKFAAVGEGTLLLDEINALPPHLQCKLLRAVDERLFEPVGSNQVQPLRARLIAVSNTPLDQEVIAGRFRPDLYYRLNVVSFYLPPLRDRPTAIVPLCNKFVAEFAAKNRPDIRGLSPQALRALEEYHWPGNIRELRNVIERAVALSEGPVIKFRDLPAVLSAPNNVQPGNNRSEKGLADCTLSETKEEAEIQRISAALSKHRNNRLRAAAELGISRMGLYKKLRKYGLMETGEEI